MEHSITLIVVLSVLRIFPYALVAYYAYRKAYMRLCVAALISVFLSVLSIPQFGIGEETLGSIRVIIAFFIFWHALEMPNISKDK